MACLGHAVKAGSSAPLQNSPELGCVFHYISRISRECFRCISEGVRLRQSQAPAFYVRRDKAALFQILWGDRRGSVKVPLYQT